VFPFLDSVNSWPNLQEATEYAFQPRTRKVQLVVLEATVQEALAVIHLQQKQEE
jgi:hypothetical protein